MTTITDNGVPVPERDAQTIFEFVAWMAAVVAARRGGSTSDHIHECAQFMVDVVGRALSVADDLPSNFDWRPSAAIECANALMEYDL